MHLMLSDGGKESNTAKGVNIETHFGEFRDTLFNKRVVRHKMKKIKVKNTNLEHMKSTKYHYRVLMIKSFVLNDGIHTLAYFHKDFYRFLQMIIKKEIQKDS